MTRRSMTRFKAFGIHLGISLLIFAALAALVVWVWYPGFFFQTDGGWQGIRIIVLVDLVLGPLLTLVVYKAGKPGLKMDLTLIALFQFACLIAGTYVVYNERPLAVVFVDGQFNAISANSFRNSDVDMPDFSQFPGPSPKWILVDMPADPIAQSDARRKMMDQQLPVALLTEYYRPFDTSNALFTDDSTAFAEIEARDHENSGAETFFQQHGGSAEDYLFYPYAARYEYYYLGFSTRTRELAGPLIIHTLEPPEPER